MPLTDTELAQAVIAHRQLVGAHRHWPAGGRRHPAHVFDRAAEIGEGGRLQRQEQFRFPHRHQCGLGNFTVRTSLPYMSLRAARSAPSLSCGCAMRGKRVVPVATRGIAQPIGELGQIYDPITQRDATTRRRAFGFEQAEGQVLDWEITTCDVGAGEPASPAGSCVALSSTDISTRRHARPFAAYGNSRCHRAGRCRTNRCGYRKRLRERAVRHQLPP